MEQMEPLQDNLEQEILELESQLKEALAAETFFETASGKIISQIITKQVTRLTREVTSNKYRKDHAGYNNALSDLQAFKYVLKYLQTAKDPKRINRIKEELDDVAEGVKENG